MINIYDIEGNVLMQAEITSSAVRYQEMSKSDYISLTWTSAEKVILPVGAYIEHTYKIDSVREVTRQFLLLEAYEPTQSDEMSWKYTPEFQHPMILLSKIPFYIKTKNSQNEDIKQHVWSFVGTMSTMAGKIEDFLNKEISFGEASWVVQYDSSNANTVNVSFSENDFISALTAIVNAIGDNCEWHIDYDNEVVYIGKIQRDDLPSVTLKVGENVGIPSISSSKESYYNNFAIFGGTRNITQVNNKGENISSSDIRLQLAKGNGTIEIDGKDVAYTIDEYSTLDLRKSKNEPLFTKVLDFSQIFPSLNTYVYNVRGREKYVLDENNKKIPLKYYTDGSVAAYKTFTVWYMRLAYPTTEEVSGKTPINTTTDDGVIHYWYDFEATDDMLINGKNIGCSFEANFKTGALTTPLAGRGTNGDYVGFELIYHKLDIYSTDSDDVSREKFHILAGDYEIIYQEDDDLIIPTNVTEMLIPRGESLPSLNCNITVMYNIAMADTIYYKDAQKRLLDTAIEEIQRLQSDLNNYAIKSYPQVFVEQNPCLQIGQPIVYDDGNGYTLNTRVLKLETNIDFDFVQEITIGNQAIKGTITQLKEDVASIIASGNNSDSGGYTSAQLINLIGRYGTKFFLSKLYDDVAQGFIWLKKGFAVGAEKLYGMAKDGVATVKDLFVKGDAQVSGDATILGTVVVDRVHDRNSTEADRTIVGAQGYDLYMGSDGKSHLYVDYLTARTKFFASQAEIRKVSYSGGTTIFSNAGSRIAKVAYVYDTEGKEVVAYKCYAAADDGTTQTANWWHVGMMALCQTFNVKAGQKSDDLQNRYYWRLVVGVGQEVLDDGKLYDYVVLSNVKRFLGSASNVPVYTDGVFANEEAKYLEWGDVLLAITQTGGTSSLAAIFEAMEGKSTDDGGTAVASRYFYGYEPSEDGGEPDAPQSDDVIVQAGDQIRWKSYGNLIKQSTSSEDNDTDTAPSTTYYHEMGAPYQTGSVDEGGVQIVNPYQWKTVTAVISPAKVRFNTDVYELFQGDETNTIDPVVVMYDVIPSTQFMVRDQESKTCTPSNITFTLQKRTGNKVETVTDNMRWYATKNGGTETLVATASSVTLSNVGTPYDITSLKLRVADTDGSTLASFDLPIVSNGTNGDDGTSVSIKGKCKKHCTNYAAIGTYGDIGTYVIVDSSADFPADKCSSDSTFAATPSVAEYVSAPDWDWRVKKAEAGDGYLDDNGDLWVAGDTSWTNVGNIKGEQGDPGQNGNDAIEFTLSGSPMVFDTDKNGVVSDTASKSATLQAWQSGKNVTASVVFANDTQEGLHIPPTITKGTDTCTVTISGSSITSQTIDGSKVSNTSGFAQIKAIYGGVSYYVQIPFSVNVAKFNHEVYSTAQESINKYTEVSSNVTKAQTKADDAYNKAQGAQDSADDAQDAAGNAQDAADKAQSSADAANQAISELPLNTEEKLTAYTSAITQSAREISLTVQSEAVGRRNILTGSHAPKQDGWVYMSGGVECEGAPAERIEIASGMDGTPAMRGRSIQLTSDPDTYVNVGFRWFGSSPQGNIKVEKGKTYILSYWAKTSTPSAILFVSEFLWQGSITDTSRPAGYEGPAGYTKGQNVTEAGKWTRLEAKIEIPTTAKYDYMEVCLFCRATGYTVAEGYICRPMLEEASEYNGWTLSEHDYDYVGGNMLDNTASLTVGDNLTLAQGTVVSGGYDGDTAYILATIESTATDDHTEVLEWKTDGMGITPLGDYVLSFMAKGSGELQTYLYPSASDCYVENAQGDVRTATDGWNATALTPEWRRYWVHWKPQASDQTNVLMRLMRPTSGTSSVCIAQPKLEHGAVRTAYTERKSDLVDKQTLKAAGISITDGQVELYGDQVKVSATKGGEAVAMFEDGKLSADVIDAETIVVDGLQGNTIDAKNATIGNLNVTDVNVNGTMRSGYTTIKDGEDLSKTDNYYVYNDEDFSFFDLKWDSTQIGRTIRIANHTTSVATIKTKEDSQYFITNGQSVHQISIAYRHCMVLHGLGYDSTFVAWVVENSYSYYTPLPKYTMQYLAKGSVIYWSNSYTADIYQMTYNGRIEVSRTGVGVYRLLLPTSWSAAYNQYSSWYLNTVIGIMLTGMGGVYDSNTNTRTEAPAKASVKDVGWTDTAKTQIYIDVWVSDDETVNDGDFQFLIYNLASDLE